MVAPIVQWKPIHDQIVALHIAGYGCDAIGTIVGRSKGNVAAVLKDPRAKKATAIARKHTYGSIMNAVGDRMVALGEKAVDNIADTINAELHDEDGKVAVGSKAKTHQDNVSFALLERIGFGRNQKEEGDNGLKLSPETEKKLVEGIEKAIEANVAYEAIEEVPFEEVKAGGNGNEPD